MDLPVEIPPDALAFKDAKDITVWEYEKKIKEIEGRQKSQKQVRDQEKVKETSKDKELLKNKSTLVDDAPLPLERQVYMYIISSIK